MQVTAAQLKRIAKGTPDSSNLQSVLMSINAYGTGAGLDLPHRLAHFLCQELHESGGFRYDKEIASGAAYEGREDLGNTERGDGEKFKGRGPEQMTGRGNYRRFTAWVRTFIPNCPDFEQDPDLVNTDPYEGLSAIWYWTVGNPTGKSLNIYADQNNIEMITRKINGGLNGYDDRLDYFDRCAFVFLGYPLGAYLQFQKDAVGKWGYDGKADDMAGPKTRAAMFTALVQLGDQSSETPLPANTSPSPVVVTKTVDVPVEVKVPDPVAVPVTVTNLDKPWYTTMEGAKEMLTAGAGTLLTGALGAPWTSILAIGGVFLLGGIAFYFIRQKHATDQTAAVTRIEAANTGAFAPAPGAR
jgi:putative chitinase